MTTLRTIASSGFSRRGSRVLAGAVVVTVVAGGVAFAYFTSMGSGHGSGELVAETAPVVIAGPDAVPSFAPGAIFSFDGENAGWIDNSDNDIPISVEKVEVSISKITRRVNGTWQIVPATDCDREADFTFTHAEGPFEVPAGGIADWSGGSITMKDDPARNQNGCKGVRLTLAYTASTF